MTTASGPSARARDHGFTFGGTPGPHNAITDVPGVEVGYTTLNHGTGSSAVRTGVTAILPRGKTGVGVPAAAGFHSLNGNGELTGTQWIEETGLLTLPIGLTNSHSVGTVHRGIIDWVVTEFPDIARDWLLPVVGETYDGDLNDINGQHVHTEHVLDALGSAEGGAIAEGNIGGGTGMICYEFKGGSGTASRTVDYGSDRFHVGAFAQANFGSRSELTIQGVPVGRNLPLSAESESERVRPPGGGSVIVVMATDAPLLPGQCKALARRVPMGLARTGTTGSHFSGDIFLAFSTGNADTLHSGYSARPVAGSYDTSRHLPWPNVDPFYTAAVESVEEAIVNVLVAEEAMVGRNGFSCPELPIARTLELLGHAEV
jgi:L-aminopeptidase/D-esterase-like protein